MRSRKFGLVVCLAVVAGMWSGAATYVSAAEPEQHAAIMVKAQGKAGTVTRTKRTAAQARAEDGLPPELNGGAIPRSALKAELANGIGRFFQQVRPEPVVSRGRFVGWRIVALFPNRPDVKVQGVKAGDIVLRVNGESIERPEDFKALWDTLGDATQIVVDIQRGDETTSVRYTIS